MQSLSKSLCLCGMIIFISAGALAATYYVDDDGPNDPGPFDPKVPKGTRRDRI